MNYLLWILQGLLAVMMLVPGLLKLSNSNDELKKKGDGRLDWADDVSSSQMKFIGLVEVLAGLGLILPQLLGTLPWLTPLAAVGVILTMIGAMILHIRRGDGAKALVINIIILLVAAFIAYGRIVIVPV